MQDALLSQTRECTISDRSGCSSTWDLCGLYTSGENVALLVFNCAFSWIWMCILLCTGAVIQVVGGVIGSWDLLIKCGVFGGQSTVALVAMVDLMEHFMLLWLISKESENISDILSSSLKLSVLWGSLFFIDSIWSSRTDRSSPHSLDILCILKYTKT